MEAGVGDAGVEGDVLDTTAAGALVIRGGMLRTLGYVLATALTVVSAALVTRYLGVSRFGDYQTALSIVAVVATITEAGMATLAVREYATHKGAERELLMRNLLGARIGLTSVGVIAAAIIGAALGFDELLLIGTVLAGVGLGLNVVQSMVAVPLVATLRLGIATLLEAGRQAVLVALLVVVVLLKGGVTLLLAATVPAGLIAVFATAYVLRGAATLRPQFHAAEWRRLFILTFPVALAMTAGTLYVYFVQVLTDTIANDFESGVFAASFRVFLVVGAVPGLIVATSFPLLARAERDDHERLQYAVDRLFKTSTLAGGFFALVLGIGAPFAIDVIAGSSFDESVGVLQVQAGALLASFAVATLGFTMLTLRMHRELVLVNLAGLVAAGVTAAVLIGPYGAQGAAWATVVGESVLLAGCWITLALKRREFSPSLLSVLPVAPPLVAGAAVILLGLPSLIACLLAGIVYFAVALITRAVPDELVEIVRSRLR
jgi:O-antigen/teichoic acid export membrane protein